MLMKALNYSTGSTANVPKEPADKNNFVIDYHRTASERSIDMLLKKFYHREYHTEIEMPEIQDVSGAVPQKDLSLSTILLLTDGGLVPKGNPDHVAPFCGNGFYVYDIDSVQSLDAADYQISHQGYDHAAVLADPNRLVPVDAARRLVKKGVIHQLYHKFISVAGVMTPTKQSILLGKDIARYIANCPVDGVVITSTCGTSTRCGTYIAQEIRKLGIPVVQIANLVNVAQSYGMRKVVKGNSIDCPLGNPDFPEKEEADMRLRLLEEALMLLVTE